jgi:hypothetical protein
MSNVTDRVKTLEDVGAALNIDLQTFGNSILLLPGIPDEDKYYLVNQYRWIKIAEALNEGWEADYLKHYQAKYYPYQYKVSFNKKSGFGFSRSSTHYDYAHTIVGARSLFKTWELADYAMKQWPDVYLACTVKNKTQAIQHLKMEVPNA